VVEKRMTRRWILMSLALLGSCKASARESMMSPVRGFLSEVKSGTADAAAYRSYVGEEVADPLLEEWIRNTREVMVSRGSEARFQVVGVGESEAHIRVTFACPGETKPGFDVWVESRSSGWWIVQVDHESLASEIGDDSKMFTTSGATGGSSRLRRSRR